MRNLLTRDWWATALRGVAAVLFGILTLAWPGVTLRVIVALFGAYAVVNGVLALAASRKDTNGRMQSISLLLSGVLNIIAGLVAWFWPGLTALALLWVIVAWSLVTGAMAIGAAVELRGALPHSWLLGLNGVLSIALGVAFAVHPGAGILTVLVLLGFYAIVAGASLIAFAFWIRGIQQDAGPSGSRLAHST
jgi:uncharacterized membrane protein HdeD (DUF308 family)